MALRVSTASAFTDPSLPTRALLRSPEPGQSQLDRALRYALDVIY